MPEKETKFSGYLVIGALCLYAIACQGTYSISTICLMDMAEGYGVDVAMLMYYNSIIAAFACFGNLLFERLLNKLGLKGLFLLATVSAFAGMLLISVGSSFSIIVVAALLEGIMVAFGYVSALSVMVQRWFYDKRAQMVNIVLGCTTLGACISVLVGARMLVALGSFRSVYRILAFVLCGIMLLVTIFFIKTPDQMGQKMLGWEHAVEEDETEAVADAGGPSLGAIMKTIPFWLVLFGAFCGAMCFEGVFSYGPTYLMSYGMSEIDASNLAMICSLACFFTGTLGGIVSDKFGNRVFVIYVCGTMIAGWMMMYVWPGNGSWGFALAALLVSALAYPLEISLAPTINTEIFGDAAYQKVTPIMVAGGNIGAVFTAFIFNAVTAATGEMRGFYLVTAVIIAIAAVGLMVCFGMSKSVKQKLAEGK